MDKPKVTLYRETNNGRTDIWASHVIDENWRAAFRIVSNGYRWKVAEARIFPVEENYIGDGEWSANFLGIEADAPGAGLTRIAIRKASPHAWLCLSESLGEPPAINTENM